MRRSIFLLILLGLLGIFGTAYAVEMLPLETGISLREGLALEDGGFLFVGSAEASDAEQCIEQAVWIDAQGRVTSRLVINEPYPDHSVKTVAAIDGGGFAAVLWKAGPTSYALVTFDESGVLSAQSLPGGAGNPMPYLLTAKGGFIVISSTQPVRNAQGSVSHTYEAEMRRADGVTQWRHVFEAYQPFFTNALPVEGGTILCGDIMDQEVGYGICHGLVLFLDEQGEESWFFSSRERDFEIQRYNDIYLLPDGDLLLGGSGIKYLDVFEMESMLFTMLRLTSTGERVSEHTLEQDVETESGPMRSFQEMLPLSQAEYLVNTRVSHAQPEAVFMIVDDQGGVNRQISCVMPPDEKVYKQTLFQTPQGPCAVIQTEEGDIYRAYLLYLSDLL